MPWFKMVAHVGCVVTLVWPVATLSAQGLPVAAQPAVQNPSPMLETTRAHERLTPRALGGTTRTFPGPLAKPVELWVPERDRHPRSRGGDWSPLAHGPRDAGGLLRRSRRGAGDPA